MCLLGIGLWQFDEMPVLVLANREEFYARPTAGPRIFPREGEMPAWFGGIDLLAGGTWLGVNEFGLLVAVTNRKKHSPPANPPSRGLLCRTLLTFRETASAAATAERELGDNRYAGCNLLIADRESAVVIEAADVLKSTRLDPGLHLVANGAFDAPDDPRIHRVRKEFERVRGLGVEAWFDEARRVCPLTAEGSEPPICLTGADRGTVSSTVLGIARDAASSSRYWYAAGPPNTTPYEDYSPLLREMLAHPADQAVPDIEPPDDSPARRAVRQSLTCRIKDRDGSTPAAPGSRGAFENEPENRPYRILLRGPWQCEPLARAERDAAGALVWSTTGLPPAGTVRLPATWQDLFGDFRGRVRFRRRFHPPSNIEPGDRLFIVFDGFGGTGPVSVNGHYLGKLDTAAGNATFDVTGLLQVNNEIVVELEFASSAADTPPGGLIRLVALEIHS
ncbi:MAG: NRDE family protein, partial [Deltaproteobacteria bacterium]